MKRMIEEERKGGGREVGECVLWFVAFLRWFWRVFCVFACAHNPVRALRIRGEQQVCREGM